jgi:polyadenylate-binding protein
MRHFDLNGKPCRALPFDKDLLGSNRSKIVDHNIFVKNIPAEHKRGELEEYFSKYGPIKSSKISLDGEYNSRGYGFVCFENAESAQAALDDTARSATEMVIQRYRPTDRRDMRKAFNNVYVKNFPATYTEDDLRKLFGQIGKILSLQLFTNEKGAFAFVCFGDADRPDDKEYGPACALKAISELNEKEIEGQKLYVKEALKKEDRQIEKQKEMMRYKNSKKRCNLFVKNFPPNTTKEQLEELFGRFGEIENVKLFPKDNEVIYAFVCFKNPEKATQAKAELHMYNLNGKQLYVSHYEIKEIRKAQHEEFRDTADY